LDIDELGVIQSKPHPKSKGQVWIIQAYTKLADRFSSVTEDKLKIAKEEGVTNTSHIFLLNQEESMQMVMTRPVPTIISSDKEYLEEWLKKNQKELDLDFKRFQGMVKQGKIEYKTPTKKGR
jgi:hypothetical protein